MFNKQRIEKVSANIKYLQNRIEIINFKSHLQEIPIYSDKILINKKNKDYFVEGSLNNDKSTISSSLIKMVLKNNNFTNTILSSKNNFNFTISNKFKISDLKFNSKINLAKAEYEIDNLSIKNIFLISIKKLSFSDQNLDINYNKKHCLKDLEIFK